MQDCSPPSPQPWFVELVGWYGMAAILAAYALSTFEVIEQRWLFQCLNFTGAAGVGWVCWRKRTWQAFWLELIWSAIALVALVRLAL